VVFSNRLQCVRRSLAFPLLPEALVGLRLAHLTDLHVRRRRRRHDRIIAMLETEAPDLIAITGDVMHRPGHEDAAVELLKEMTDRVRPRFGCVGCFGNHDTVEFKSRVVELPIDWLADRVTHHETLPLTVAGLDCEYHREGIADAVGVAVDAPPPPDGNRRLRVMLAHVPRWIAPAAAMGYDLVLSGHTHGGQCRLPGPTPLYNATKGWPLRLTAGVLAMGRTRQVISRGLGESNLEGLRIACHPMLSVITLTEGEAAAQPHAPTLVEPW